MRNVRIDEWWYKIRKKNQETGDIGRVRRELYREQSKLLEKEVSGLLARVHLRIP